MLSVQFGFDTNIKRSGHAACWCSLLGGIVQFGGWPPTSQLSDVVRHEGSSCPLYVLSAVTIARHVRRAEQRRSVNLFEEAQKPSRIRRLRHLCDASGDIPEVPAGCVDMEHVTVSGAAEVTAYGTPALSTLDTDLLPVSSPRRSSITPTTTDDSHSVSRRFVYDEGYVSEPAESSHSETASTSNSSSDSSSRGSRPRVGAERTTPSYPSASPVVAPVITVELLRQAAVDGGVHEPMPLQNGAEDDHSSWTPPVEQQSQPRSTYTATTVGAGTSYSLTLLSRGVDAVALPVLQDTQEILGKKTVHPLRWRHILPAVAPRSRHGHHLVSCGVFLYLLGGSYWAHGNALASTDMIFHVGTGVWKQVAALLPSRFCAALAVSNTTPSPPADRDEDSAAVVAKCIGPFVYIHIY